MVINRDAEHQATTPLPDLFVCFSPLKRLLFNLLSSRVYTLQRLKFEYDLIVLL